MAELVRAFVDAWADEEDLTELPALGSLPPVLRETLRRALAGRGPPPFLERRVAEARAAAPPYGLAPRRAWHAAATPPDGVRTRCPECGRPQAPRACFDIPARPGEPADLPSEARVLRAYVCRGACAEEAPGSPSLAFLRLAPASAAPPAAGVPTSRLEYPDARAAAERVGAVFSARRYDRFLKAQPDGALDGPEGGGAGAGPNLKVGGFPPKDAARLNPDADGVVEPEEIALACGHPATPLTLTWNWPWPGARRVAYGCLRVGCRRPDVQ